MTTAAAEPEPVAVEKPVPEKSSMSEDAVQPTVKKQKGNDGEPVAVTVEAEPAVAADKSEMPGWPDHKMNVNKALVKDAEGKRFSEVAAAKVDILQGIGEKSAAVVKHLGVTTVAELAAYKFYKMAKAIAALAPQEEKDGRAAASVMNIDQAVDAEYEPKSLTEVLEAPVAALQGLSEAAATLLGELHVKTVSDLAAFKYCLWAEAIVTLADFEHKKSAAERKAERMAKKLE